MIRVYGWDPEKSAKMSLFAVLQLVTEVSERFERRRLARHLRLEDLLGRALSEPVP